MASRRKTTYKNSEYNNSPSILLPKNENQALYIRALDTCSQVIVFGPAGTGKTYIAATYAANLYIEKKIDKIIITRPHVPVGREIGFLPGTIEEKSQPWALPVLDVLERHMGKGMLETAIKNNNVEMVPLALIRGRNFDDSFVVVDEAQNITVSEIKALLTRVGEDSKIVLDGDIQQSDISEQSGLSKIVHLAKKYDLNIPVIEFTHKDIVRSDICKQWIEIFMKEKL